MTAKAEGSVAPDAALTHGRSRGRRGLSIEYSVAAFLVSLILATILMGPVLSAPVNADDRYWYAMIGPQTDGSISGAFRWAMDAVSWQLQQGRFLPLSDFVRATTQMIAMEASIITGLPVTVFHGATMAALIAATVVAVLLMVRSLRWRARDGSLVSVGSETYWYLAIALPICFAAGVQAHYQFRNGWTTYPVLTYSAAAFMFGSVALVLWLARLTAARQPTFLLVSITSAALLAVATCLYYEMVLPALAAVVLALIVVPVVPADRRALGIRAKTAVGGSYVVAFLLTVGLTRWWLRSFCDEAECYEGVTPSVGGGFVRTSLFNIVSTMPVARGNEILHDLGRVGLEDQHPAVPTLGPVILAILAIIVLWRAMWIIGAIGRVSPDTGGSARAEGFAVMVGVAVALTIGVGVASVMGLSLQAQEVVTEPGVAYRHLPSAWASFATAAALAVAGLTRLGYRRSAVSAGVAMVLCVAILVVAAFPVNWLLTRSYHLRPELVASEAILRELALGDATVRGDQRRCMAFESLEKSMSASSTRDKIVKYSSAAFQHYHGVEFCDATEKTP